MGERFLIGLSLSGCIKDIAEGKVNVEQVKFIVSGTCFPLDQPEVIMAHYKAYDWSHYPAKAKEVLYRLLKEGRIIQPRLYNLPYHNIALGRWAIQGHIEDLLKYAEQKEKWYNQAYFKTNRS